MTVVSAKITYDFLTSFSLCNLGQYYNYINQLHVV